MLPLPRSYFPPDKNAPINQNHKDTINVFVQWNWDLMHRGGGTQQFGVPTANNNCTGKRCSVGMGWGTSTQPRGEGVGTWGT